MVDKTDPQKSAVAYSLVKDAVTDRKGIISYQVAQEFMNVALTKFKAAMSAIELEQFHSNILEPLTKIQSSTELLIEALHTHRKYKFSWYDSLIIAAALEAECEVLYSEDMQHGMKIENLTIKNPFL